MDNRKIYNKMDKRQYFDKKIKINAESGLRDYPKDSIIKIKVDKDGNPIDPYWNRRFKDSKYDKCVSFIDTEKKIKEIKNKKAVKNKGE
jgi:hypothetical protein